MGTSYQILSFVVRSVGLIALAACITSCGSDSGGGDDPRSSWVVRWNEVAITASGRDHTPPADGDNWEFGEQMGPTRSSRALAIVHLAVYDAVMSIEPRYPTYLDTPRAPTGTSMKAAIAQAAHDTLVELYPSQRAFFDAALELDLSHIVDGISKEDGIALGKLTALQILNARAGDGSHMSTRQSEVRYQTSDRPGTWRRDPFHPRQTPLTPEWGKVRPFAMARADQFRVPRPPALSSPEYARAYDEVKRLGGDGVVTPTERTEDQTEIGYFWGYDGTPSLCAPVKLYNQIAVHVAKGHRLDIIEMTRLLAMVNVALADAGIASWESKYYWNFWRPVTGIREADESSDGVYPGDRNPDTEGDVNFTPLGAPAVNGAGRNFTPPFPAYPSGHAVFGGALFEVLRNYFGTDNNPFTFVSEEYNGITRDQHGVVRPLRPRSFATFSQAEEENGQSRVYLGVHWSFDKERGIQQGRKIADLVTDLPVFSPRG